MRRVFSATVGAVLLAMVADARALVAPPAGGMKGGMGRPSFSPRSFGGGSSGFSRSFSSGPRSFLGDGNSFSRPSFGGSQIFKPSIGGTGFSRSAPSGGRNLFPQNGFSRDAGIRAAPVRPSAPFGSSYSLNKSLLGNTSPAAPSKPAFGGAPADFRRSGQPSTGFRGFDASRFGANRLDGNRGSGGQLDSNPLFKRGGLADTRRLSPGNGPGLRSFNGNPANGLNSPRNGNADGPRGFDNRVNPLSRDWSSRFAPNNGRGGPGGPRGGRPNDYYGGRYGGHHDDDHGHHGRHYGYGYCGPRYWDNHSWWGFSLNIGWGGYYGGYYDAFCGPILGPPVVYAPPVVVEQPVVVSPPVYEPAYVEPAVPAEPPPVVYDARTVDGLPPAVAYEEDEGRYYRGYTRVAESAAPPPADQPAAPPPQAQPANPASSPDSASQQPTEADRAAVRQQLDVGDEAMRRRDYDAALKAYQQALKRDPQSPEILLVCGLAELGRGRIDAAAAAVHEGLARAPDLTPADFDIRRVFTRQDDLAARIEQLRARRSANAKDADAMLVQGFVEYFSGQTATGREALDAYHNLRPDDKALDAFFTALRSPK